MHTDTTDGGYWSKVHTPVEELAEKRLKQVFNEDGTENLWVDLRAPSGAMVNLSIMAGMFGKERGRILAPDLKGGFGHLSHGAGADSINLEHLFWSDYHHRLFKEVPDFDFFGARAPAASEEQLPNLMDEFLAILHRHGFPSSENREAAIKSIEPFLRALFESDRKTYEAIFAECSSTAVSDPRLAALASVRLPGNPTAIHRLHDVQPYTADQHGNIDYAKLAEKIRGAEPAYDVVIIGGSANPHDIEYQTVIAAAKERGTLVWIDAAHYAGLMAGGAMKNPIAEGVDIMTTTMHKSLRGEKGGAAVVNLDHIQAMADGGNTSAVRLLESLANPAHRFPLDSATMAAHATTLKFAGSPENTELAARVVENAKALSDAFKELGWTVLGDGTDSHIVLLNVRASIDCNGREIADLCEHLGIVANANGIPGDTGKPMNPDGLRLGTVALTTRGASPEHMRQIAQIIDKKGRELASSPGRNPYFVAMSDKSPDATVHAVQSMAASLPLPAYDFDGLRQALADADPELCDLLTQSPGQPVEQLLSYVRFRAQTALMGLYAEGRPGGRYYAGKKHAVDPMEALIDTRARQALEGGRSHVEVNSQATSPDIALLAIALELVQKGGNVLMHEKNQSSTALMSELRNVHIYKDRGEEGQAFDELIERIKTERPAMVVMPTTYDLDADEWLRLQQSAKEVRAVLVADNSADLDRLLKGETLNPFGTGAVDIMITNTGDVGGPENAAYTVWDPSAVRKMQEEAAKTTPVGLHTAIFPRVIGGPDMVAMVTQSVALENARRKFVAHSEKETGPSPT